MIPQWYNIRLKRCIGIIRTIIVSIVRNSSPGTEDISVNTELPDFPGIQRVIWSISVSISVRIELIFESIFWMYTGTSVVVSVAVLNHLINFLRLGI